MSFRRRLTLFFVLIVVVPMIALGVVVVRLISDRQHAKATAQNRASAAAALADYQRLSVDGARAARGLAGDDALAAALTTPGAADERARVRALARQLGLARVRLMREGDDPARPLADVGDRGAIARGAVRMRPAPGTPGRPVTIEAATLTADRFARTASVPGVRAVVKRDGALLASTLPVSLSSKQSIPDQGTVDLGGVDYTVTTFRAPDFGSRPTTVVVLTDTSAAAGAATRSQLIAIGLLILFLLLALVGALLISRQLHGQLARFLTAAKRIGGGDFSTTVPIEGEDEFAELGREFNKMSRELEQRIRELGEERARLRESIQRVGATFAANLDRSALLEIGTQTIVDAVEARCGRADAARRRRRHAARSRARRRPRRRRAMRSPSPRRGRASTATRPRRPPRGSQRSPPRSRSPTLPTNPTPRAASSPSPARTSRSVTPSASWSPRSRARPASRSRTSTCTTRSSARPSRTS